MKFLGYGWDSNYPRSKMERKDGCYSVGSGSPRKDLSLSFCIWGEIRALTRVVCPCIVQQDGALECACALTWDRGEPGDAGLMVGVSTERVDVRQQKVASSKAKIPGPEKRAPVWVVLALALSWSGLWVLGWLTREEPHPAGLHYRNPLLECSIPESTNAWRKEKEPTMNASGVGDPPGTLRGCWLASGTCKTVS